uniref:Integrase catalytic domain-containing protein n=1 Tax=Fagus sylvatica TaxID=28930 RepID=A0A2N9EUP8_FAGSY
MTISVSSRTISALQASPVTISASPRPLGFLAFTISASSCITRLGGSRLLLQHRQTSISASRLLLLLRQLSVALGSLWNSSSLSRSVGLAPPVGLGCSSSTARPRRTKLKGSNYLQWSRAVRVFLTGCGKESYLTTTKPVDATKIPQWLKEDAQIMTWLWNSLEPDVFNNVSYLESSKDIWDTLHLMYSSEENITRIHELYQDMFSLQQGDRSIEEYFSLLQDLDPIRSQILSGKDIPTVSETYARVRRAAISSSGVKDERSALVGHYDTPQGERGDHSSRRGTHNGRGSRGGCSGGGGRGPRKCTHCGRTNHTIDFCWKLHGKLAWANHATIDGDNSTPTSEEQVLISKAEYDSILQRASSSSMVVSGNTCLHSSSSPPWVINSGASDHMTDNSSLLSNILNPCSPFSVTVANGTKTSVQGIGTVSTPNLTFSNDLKTKRTIGGGFEKDGLYYFRPFHTSIPSALRSSVSPYQWGIIHQTSCVRTPQQNGIAERKNGPILAIARALMLQMHIPKLFWADAVLTATYLLNRMPSRVLKVKTNLIPVHTNASFLVILALRKGGQLQESILSSPVIPTPIPFAPQAPPISQIYLFLSLPQILDLPIALRKISSIVVPKSYRETLSHPGWRKAMEEEMHALDLNHTWDLVHKPAAHLVAKGFTQTYGLDYTETFSPVAKLNSIRIIISLAANLDWPLHQLDVKNAFLHGDLNETVYMAQPPGFESKGEYVCHLKKSIYGLKQSPHAWFDKFSKTVVSHGMIRSQADHSVFFKKTKIGIVILVVYVDDIVITGSDKEGIQILINHLSSSFLTKYLGKLRYFLGIEVARSKAGISLSQRKYTLDILQDTGYLGSKPVATPMESNLKLMPDEGDFIDDPDTYRRLVGKLIYLTITRPDISYAVSVVSQFMTNPRVPHMNAVIRILKYLKNAPGRGLFYRSSGHLRIEGYTDADWVGSPSDRKSTTGYCTFIGGNLVTWRSKKQSVVARSSAEAEYRAMAHTTSIHIASNPVFHERTKHIEVDCHFIRSKVESKDIITPFIPSGSQLADVFTKALPKNAIDSICSKLGVIDIYSLA